MQGRDAVTRGEPAEKELETRPVASGEGGGSVEAKHLSGPTARKSRVVRATIVGRCVELGPKVVGTGKEVADASRAMGGVRNSLSRTVGGKTVGGEGFQWKRVRRG